MPQTIILDPRKYLIKFKLYHFKLLYLGYICMELWIKFYNLALQKRSTFNDDWFESFPLETYFLLEMIPFILIYYILYIFCGCWSDAHSILWVVSSD